MMRNEHSTEYRETPRSSHNSETKEHVINRSDSSEGMQFVITEDLITILEALQGTEVSSDALRALSALVNKSTFTSTHNARIKAISAETGRSKDEVISAALGLYELALKAQEHNKKFGVVEPDQQLITEVSFL